MKDLRMKIKAPIAAWDIWEISGNLVDIIAKLQKQIDENPTFFDFDIDVETESGYYNSCSTNVTITGFRWETDEEMNERIDLAKRKSEAAKLAAKRTQEANEKRERSLYESLKKKFEKEINETSKGAK